MSLENQLREIKILIENWLSKLLEYTKELDDRIKKIEDRLNKEDKR